MPAVDEGRNRGKGKYVPPKKYVPPQPRPAPAPVPRLVPPRPVPGRYTPPVPMPSNPGRPLPARTAPRPAVYGPPAPVRAPSRAAYEQRKMEQTYGRPVRPQPYRPPGDADMGLGGTAAYNPRSVDDLDISEIGPAAMQREAFAANLERQRAAEESARTSNWQRMAKVAGYPLQVMGEAATALGRGTNALSDAGWNALEYAQGKQQTYDPARPRTAEGIASGLQHGREAFRNLPGSQYMGAAYQGIRNYQNQQQERMAQSPNPYTRVVGQIGGMGRAIGEPIEQSFQTSSPERVRSVYRDSGGGDGFVRSVNARGDVWENDPGLDQMSQMFNPVNVGASIAAPIAATGRFGQGARAAAQGWNAVNEAVDPFSLALRGVGAARQNFGAAVDDWKFQNQAMGVVPGRKPRPLPDPEGGTFTEHDPLNDVQLPGRQQPRFDQPTRVNPQQRYQGAIQTQYPDPTADEAISRLGIPNEPPRTYRRNQEVIDPVIANRQAPPPRRFGGPSDGTSGAEGLRQLHSDVEARNGERWQSYQAELDGQGVPGEARQDLRSPAYDDYFRRWETEVQELAGGDPRLSYGGWSKTHNLKAETTAYVNALRDSGRYTPSQELWKQMRRDLSNVQTQSRAQAFGPQNQYPQGQSTANTVDLWREMFGTDVDNGIDQGKVSVLLQQEENPLADPRAKEYARKMRESLQTEQMLDLSLGTQDRQANIPANQTPFSIDDARLRDAEAVAPPKRLYQEQIERGREQPDWGEIEQTDYDGGYAEAQGMADATGPRPRDTFEDPQAVGPNAKRDDIDYRGRDLMRSKSTTQFQNKRGGPPVLRPAERTGRSSPSVQQVQQLINEYPDLDQHLVKGADGKPTLDATGSPFSKNPEVQELLNLYRQSVSEQIKNPNLDTDFGIPQGPRRMPTDEIGRRGDAYRQQNPMQVDPRQQRLANRFVQQIQNIPPVQRQEIARQMADEGAASMLLNQIGYRARSQMITRPGQVGASGLPTDYSNWNDAFTDVLIGIADSEQGFAQVNPGDLTPSQLNSAINGIESRANSNALPEVERLRLQDLAYNLRGLREELGNLDAPEIAKPNLPTNVAARPNPYASPEQMLGMKQPSGNPLVDALTGLGDRSKYAFEEAYAKPFRNRKRLGITPQGPGAPDPDPFQGRSSAEIMSRLTGVGQTPPQTGVRPNPQPRNMNDAKARQHKADADRLAGRVDSPAQQPLNQPQTPVQQGKKAGIDKGRVKQKAVEAAVGAAIGTAIFGGSNLYLDLQQEKRIRANNEEKSRKDDERFQKQQGVYEQDEQGDREYSQQNQARMNADQLYDQIKSTLPPDQWALLDGVSRARLEQIYVQNADNQAKAEADARQYIQSTIGQEPPSWVEQEIIGADLGMKDAERFYNEIQKSPDYSFEQKRDAENALFDARDSRNYFARWFIESQGVSDQDRENLALRLGVDYDEVMAATADYTTEDQSFYDTEYGQQLQSFQLPADGSQGLSSSQSQPSGGGNVSPAPKLPPGRSRSGSSTPAKPTGGPAAGSRVAPQAPVSSARPTRQAPTGRPSRAAPANAGGSGGGSTPRKDQVRPNPYTGVWEVWNGQSWQKTADPVRGGGSGGGSPRQSRGFPADPNTGYAGKGIGPSGQLESIYMVGGQRKYESELGDYQAPLGARGEPGGQQAGRQPDPRTGYVGQTIGPSGQLETMYEIDGQVYYESQLGRYQAPDIYGQGQSQGGQSPIRDWNDGPRGDESLIRKHPMEGWQRWIDPDGAGELPVGWYGDMEGESGSGSTSSSTGYSGGGGYAGNTGKYSQGGSSSDVSSWGDLSMEERTALVRAIQGNGSWLSPEVKALMEKYGLSRKKILDLYMTPGDRVQSPRSGSMSRYL